MKLTWLLVLGGLGCRAAADTPPVDPTALLADLEFLASDSLDGRASGTPGNELARRYIAAAFDRADLRPFGSGWEHPFRYVTTGGDSLTGVNVLAWIQGHEFPDRYIVLSAHFDHLGGCGGAICNGADDNASGTAAILTLARHFLDRPLRHSLVIAAFDAEERGLRGARAFVASPPVPLERIRLNVNLDMISHSDSTLYAAGTHHYPALAEPLRLVGAAAAVDLRFGHDRPELGSDDWTSASDHAPFHGAGVPFIYFGVEDHPDYHKPTDEFDTINPTFYVAAVETIAEAIARLDAALDPPDGES